MQVDMGTECLYFNARMYQAVRVSWDGSKVSNKAVHDYLPTLLRSTAVKPGLLILDDAWDINQVHMHLTLFYTCAWRPTFGFEIPASSTVSPVG